MQHTEGSNRQMLDEKFQGQSYTVAPDSVPSSFERYFYIESYGCAMNFSDSEIVASILQKNGYGPTKDYLQADLILINTCSIREKGEHTVRKRLRIFDQVKTKKPATLIGVLGCMAERLKTKLLEEEKLVDIVVGPDAYRDLPKLISGAEEGDKGINVLLSREETYADINPIRLQSNGVNAFISIMRGCDNMCSFCVVPFTRGRERSRDLYSILAEAQSLYDQGYRDITLLGQNVDSYLWSNPENNHSTNFAQLLEATAKIHPDLRIRFSTSHPKDITDDVLHTMARYDNICKYIHLPLQSGSSRILQLMNRTYDQTWYRQRVQAIRRILPQCAISSDIICGFCSETEQDHQDTLEMIQWAQYSMSYMFFYSERPGTLAARKYPDDVPLYIKKKRLQEVVQLQTTISARLNQQEIGTTHRVLIEGFSKKSKNDFKGRNSQNKMIVFPKVDGYMPGDYIDVSITDATSATLIGQASVQQCALITK